MSVRVMHCARVLLFMFSYGKFTTNSNKNIQFGIFALWRLQSNTFTERIPKISTDQKTNSTTSRSIKWPRIRMWVRSALSWHSSFKIADKIPTMRAVTLRLGRLWCQRNGWPPAELSHPRSLISRIMIEPFSDIDPLGINNPLELSNTQHYSSPLHQEHFLILL